MSQASGDAAVLGGAVSGLAAAHGLARVLGANNVTVFEQQTYDEKRVNCGEAINDTSLIPLDTTPDNGFVNDVTGYQLRVYSGLDRPRDHGPIGSSNLFCDPGFICERNVVERRWARQLERQGVTLRTGEAVSIHEYESIVESYDYVIDATGQPCLSLKARDMVGDYTGDMVALNATVEGDFSEYVNWPRIFFEGYVGYAWSFPKSEEHANVGIGWAGDERPDDYMEALTAAAERNDFPVPEREDVNIYTIPRGPSLDPREVYFPDDNVFLVGDAAGIANRYQGEGICQGIRSAYLLCNLIERESESTYPEKLYERMKSEYRLAHLMRGAWVEHEDPELLAGVAEALEGLTIDEITRSPSRVIARVVRNPNIAARLVFNRGMLRRLYESYTDRWEYSQRGGTVDDSA